MSTAPANFEEMLKKVVPPTTRVRVEVDGDLLQRREDLLAELVAAGGRGAAEEEIEALTSQVEELDKAREDAVWQFTFRAVGSRGWRDMVEKNPPTKEQRDKGWEYHPEEMPLAVVSTCCVEPVGIGLDEARRLRATLTEAQWDALWSACLRVNLRLG